MDTSNEGNDIGFDATSSSLHNTKKSLLSTNPHGLQFQFRLEDLIQFIFPKNLQHPLTNARLFIFALYGPLDQNGKLRSGRGGQHVLMEYELDEMCMQIEREDLIQVYMHRPRDMATLVTSEQEAIINQADAHLKRAKGRAMLPQLRQEEIEDLFQDFSRDMEGKISFHEAQEMLHKYREDRVKRFKLVYPDLTNKNKSSLNTTRKNSVESSSLNTFQNQIAQATGNITMGSLASTSLADSKNQKHKTVAPYIAPQTMFQKDKGCNNADLLEVTMKQLSKHGNKILDIDAKASTH
eukprot:gene15456-17297_t